MKYSSIGPPKKAIEVTAPPMPIRVDGPPSSSSLIYLFLSSLFIYWLIHWLIYRLIYRSIYRLVVVAYLVSWHQSIKSMPSSSLINCISLIKIHFTLGGTWLYHLIIFFNYNIHIHAKKHSYNLLLLPASKNHHCQCHVFLGVITGCDSCCCDVILAKDIYSEWLCLRYS